jgi:hypothetical protein
MRSEQLAELVRSHTDGGQDATQGSPWHVLAAMGWHGGSTPVGVAHKIVAAVNSCDSEASAFERFNYLHSRYSRDATRHKPASYQRSGNVECQRHLVWYPHLFDEKLQAGAQVGKRRFLRRPVAECGHAGTKLGRGAPNAVLILLDDVRHVNDASHKTNISNFPPRSRRCCRATFVSTSEDGSFVVPRTVRSSVPRNFRYQHPRKGRLGASCLRRSICRAQVHNLIARNVVELIDLPVGQPGHPSRAMTQEQAATVLKTASGKATGYVRW